MVIFREIMQESFGDERFWMFQRRWCEAEYLNQKAHNGESMRCTHPAVKPCITQSLDTV